jgi:hypothetical protein
MSHTVRVGGTRDGKAVEAKNRRPYFSTESKNARKATTKALRRATSEAIAKGTPDDAPRPRRTSGWLTH